MNRNKKKQKTKEEEINEVLVELENYLNNFKLSIDKKDKTKEYIRLLELAKKRISKTISGKSSSKTTNITIKKKPSI